MSGRVCEVEGCDEPAVAFNSTANHYLCKAHHDLFFSWNTPLPPSWCPKLKYKEKH